MFDNAKITHVIVLASLGLYILKKVSITAGGWL